MVGYNQIIKPGMPVSLLCNFIKTHFAKRDQHYIIDKVGYKKMTMFNRLAPFLTILEKYYHSSKKFYIQRLMDYKNFITIMRQLCKYHNIAFISKIQYCYSEYNMEYKVEFPPSFITHQ